MVFRGVCAAHKKTEELEPSSVKSVPTYEHKSQQRGVTDKKTEERKMGEERAREKKSHS